MHQLDKKIELLKHSEELEWDRTRTLMAFIANQNPYREKGAPTAKPDDFIKLSWDKAEEKQKESKLMTAEEVEKKFGKLTDAIKHE